MRRYIIIAISCILALLCYEFISPYHFQRQQVFSQAVWLKSDPEQRGSMARDLVRGNYLTPNLTNAEVVELLGIPDSQTAKYLYFSVGYMGMNPHWPELLSNLVDGLS